MSESFTSPYVQSIHGGAINVSDEAMRLGLGLAVLGAMVVLYWYVEKSAAKREAFDRDSSMNRMQTEVSQPGQTYKFRNPGGSYLR